MDKRQVVTVKAIELIRATSDSNVDKLDEIFDALSQTGVKEEQEVKEKSTPKPAVDPDPVKLVEEEIEKGTEPLDILQKITAIDFEMTPSSTEMTREQCLEFIKNSGLEFKDEVDLTKIDLSTLKNIVADIKLTDEEDIVDDSVQEEEVDDGAFDYRKVEISDMESPEESKKSVDTRINELIVKIVGSRPSEKERRIIVGWQGKYEPTQILMCLRDTHSKSAETLRHTDLMLKTRYPQAGQQQGQQGMPMQGQFGKFRMG